MDGIEGVLFNFTETFMYKLLIFWCYIIKLISYNAILPALNIVYIKLISIIQNQANELLMNKIKMIQFRSWCVYFIMY